MDRHRFHREGLGGVLREHGDDGIEHDEALVVVGARALNEHVLCARPDARVLAVDDRREREHPVGRVHDHRVHWRSLENGQELLEGRVARAVVGEELLRIEGALLRQRHEFDLLGRQRAVPERGRERVEVVRADRDERAPPAHIVVHAVLEVEEGVVRALVEGAIAQHRAHNERPDLRRRRLDGHREQPAFRRRQMRVLGPRRVLEEDV